MRIVTAVVLLVFALPYSARGETVAVSLSGGKSLANWHGQADIQALTVEWLTFPRKRTAIGVWVGPQSIWQPRSWFGSAFGDGNERVLAIAAGGVIRHHFGSGFVELHGGPVWSEVQVPAATSQLNFLTEPGAGMIFRQNSRFPVMVALRFAHISNGGLSPRNPGWNFTSFAVGTIWKRR